MHGSLTAIEGRHTSGHRPGVCVAPDAEQMRLFIHVLVAIEDWNTVCSVALWSVKNVNSDMPFKIQKIQKCVGTAALQDFVYMIKIVKWSSCSFSVKQPLGGQTLV